MGFSIVLTPPYLLWNCLHDLLDTLRGLFSTATPANVRLFLRLLIAVDLVLVGWSVYVAVLFFGKRRRFRWAWIVLASSLFVLSNH
jgi:hypothetical protein